MEKKWSKIVFVSIKKWKIDSADAIVLLTYTQEKPKRSLEIWTMALEEENLMLNKDENKGI